MYLIICITSDHTIEKGEEKRYKRCQRILLGQVYIKEITSQNVRKLKTNIIWPKAISIAACIKEYIISSLRIKIGAAHTQRKKLTTTIETRHT